MNVSNLAGTFILIMVFAALLKPIQIAINDWIMPNTQGISTFFAGLIVPVIFLAILTTIVPENTRR